GEYSIERLTQIMYDKGLRTRGGVKLVRSRLHDILSDPFFIGKNRWKDKVYQGKQESLISKETFERVQTILKRKTTSKYRKHDFLFKGRVMCKDCNGLLTWERQKGIIYGHCTGCQKGKKRAWYKEDIFASV